MTVTADASQIQQRTQRKHADIGGTTQLNPRYPNSCRQWSRELGQLFLGCHAFAGRTGLDLRSAVGGRPSGRRAIAPARNHAQNATLVLGGRLLPLVFTVGGQIKCADSLRYSSGHGAANDRATWDEAFGSAAGERIRAAEPAIFSTDSSGKGRVIFTRSPPRANKFWRTLRTRSLLEMCW
jgi:hypothetical protein